MKTKIQTDVNCKNDYDYQSEGGTRRRTAYKNPWARWLRWAAIVAVSVVSVSVVAVPGGWVAGGWLRKFTFVEHLSLKLTFSKKLLGHLSLKLTFSKS